MSKLGVAGAILVLMGILLPPSLSGAGCGYFYSEPEYRGRELKICENDRPKEDWSWMGEWNDRISSFRIDPGAECVVTIHSFFAGPFRYLAAGSSSPRLEKSWDRMISSVKCAAQGFFTRNLTPDGQGQLFEHAHFAGRSLQLDRITSKYSLEPLDHKISSYKLGPGIQCQAFEHRDFRGRSLYLDAGSSSADLGEHDFNDRIGSIKCWPKNDFSDPGRKGPNGVEKARRRDRRE